MERGLRGVLGAPGACCISTWSSNKPAAQILQIFDTFGI